MKQAAGPIVWQPPGWSPQGAVDFLRGLVDGGLGLTHWAQAGPDARWAGWLRGQGLAAYAWRRLKDTGCASHVPHACAEPLRHAYYAAAGDAELHRAELGAALDCLRAAGITPILFKGAALAHTVYPDPACRPMGDLDLWVTAEAMPAARAPRWPGSATSSAARSRGPSRSRRKYRARCS
jgi:hypothetical protein